MARLLYSLVLYLATPLILLRLLILLRRGDRRRALEAQHRIDRASLPLVGTTALQPVGVCGVGHQRILDLSAARTPSGRSR